MSFTMEAIPGGPRTPDRVGQVEWQLRVELAAVYRLVAHFRMTDLVFTHISCRLPGPDHRFLINPYGLMFEEITASNLVTVALDGQVVGDTTYTVNPAGFVIHGAIHEHRPDAHCVLHTHTQAGCAVAAQRDGLMPLNQMALEFYGRTGYHDYEGIALSNDERLRLVSNLGDNDVLILRNHGLLSVGASPAEAFLRMFYLERACQIQVAALAAGRPLVMPSQDVCERTQRQFVGEAIGDDYADPQARQLAWSALLRLLDRVDPGYAR